MKYRKYRDIDLDKNFDLGFKITYLMSKKDLTQMEIGKRHGTTYQAVSYTIWGERVSARIRLAVANELGFKTWEDLVKYKVVL